MPGLDELNPRHRRVIARTRPELQNPGVATRPLGITRPDLGEEELLVKVMAAGVNPVD